jgi:hypothetical protein
MEVIWCALELFKGPKGGSQSKTMEKEESWGTFLNSQHFRGRGCGWSCGMGLGRFHKREFKMISTYTTKQKRRLMQVECSDGLSKDNFKHKLHMACNLWEEAPLSSL